MSESNVVPFPVKSSLYDDKHVQLRKFFDLVAEAADTTGIIAYTVAALHETDPDTEVGCIHADVGGLVDSINPDWVEDTMDTMGSTIQRVWDAVLQKVEQNADDHEASDAAKAEKDEES